MQLLQHLTKNKSYEEPEKLIHALPWYLRPFLLFVLFFPFFFIWYNLFFVYNTQSKPSKYYN